VRGSGLGSSTKPTRGELTPLIGAASFQVTMMSGK
jgi:hypothetical protein